MKDQTQIGMRVNGERGRPRNRRSRGGGWDGVKELERLERGLEGVSKSEKGKGVKSRASQKEPICKKNLG